jgi:hypothetical protein
MQDVYPVITWPQTIPHPTQEPTSWGDIEPDNFNSSIQALLWLLFTTVQSASQGKDRNKWSNPTS